jgi:CHASE3 domain sensor protein
VTVDPKKCPTLARCLARGRAVEDKEWAHVVELRRAGKDDAAGRLAKKLLGIQGPPMTEEVKEKLRQYNEEHKEEIAARKKARAARQKAISRPRGKK